MYQVLPQADFVESTRSSSLVKPWKNIYKYNGWKEVESEL